VTARSHSDRDVLIAEYALNIDGEFAAGEWRRIASSDAVLLHCRS
jgi:hypothetical protein